MLSLMIAALSNSGPGESSYRLEHVSDDDLLRHTRRLVGRSNELLATLLAHLAEVDARGIHRRRACPSLYMYCVYELRLSEDAAFRRARVAKLARQFPVIFQQVADGELHLTALVLLAPHLTEENHRELLALAKHRTKREVLRIVRTLAPEPAVPDRIELLGPENIGIPVPRAASWRGLVESLAPAVRELRVGDRPKDWTDRASAGHEDGVEDSRAPLGAAQHAADAPTFAPAERYKVQFTASQEYVGLLERAQDLLSHAVQDRSLEEVHLRALRLLVEQLEKQKYGAPRSKPSTAAASESPRSEQPGKSGSEQPGKSGSEQPGKSGSERQGKKHAHSPRRSGTAAVRREVRDRDGHQCAYVDEAGNRCPETRFLQLHHKLAHALGGDPVTDNLAMFCHAHNALAAEQDFGREYMQERRAEAATARGNQARPPP